MADTNPTKPASMRKLDSIVVLERLDSTASSSYTYLRQAKTRSPRTVHETDGKSTATGDVERGESDVMPIGLDVSIRFDRLAIVMALAVSVLVVLILVFNHGVVIGHFDPTKTDADAKKKLLDDYNSYTGNVASVFGRPIEIFVALTVHVLILRVLAASLLRTEISWKMDAFTLVLSAGVGYLISNGLNALNVQPQAPTIKPMISTIDLTYVPDLSTSTAAKSTNLDHSYPEQQERNPITNTVLRTLVLPRVPVKKPFCDWRSTLKTMDNIFFPDLVLEYGFSQRDWQSRLLPEAIMPTQLRTILNPTNKRANDHVHPQDLPMNASLAADLLLISMGNMASVVPQSEEVDADTKAADDEYQAVADARRANQSMYDTAARIMGLLPPILPMQDEMAQRDWFLRESAALLTNTYFKFVGNVSRSDIVMEFSHVDISPTMRFDAITFDVEVDPVILAETPDAKNAETRYNNVYPESQCGPWAAKCMMPKPRFTTNMSAFGYNVYDPPAQVRSFGSCVNKHGTEVLTFESTVDSLACPQMSNTSMMVMSTGKRFIADSVTQSQGTNSSNISTVVKNLRRIYSFTVAKLSWELSDLAIEFNAECPEAVSSCKGLRIPLASTGTNSSQHQELIVGVDALPLDVLQGSVSGRQSLVPLVVLHEPQPMINNKSHIGYDSLAGDPLLPHNIGNISWLMSQPLPNDTACNAYFEERLQLILNNHMYIEHGLQAAYTAATFFLLQNGVVKDVIPLNATQNTLNFQENTQSVALVASIPDQNAWLTIIGCALLVVSLCSVIAWSWITSKKATRDRCCGIGGVTTPHVVARVMLDSVHFPPLFLERRVIGVSDAIHDDKQKAPSVDGFAIDGLTLQPPGEATSAASTW